MPPEGSARTGCRCVFPSPTEQELATIPGGPGSALRVRVEAGRHGYVRLEQLAFDDGLGWYVQKSFTIPGEALAALLPQLRKADCLIPRRRTAHAKTARPLAPAPPLRLCPPAEPHRREA